MRETAQHIEVNRMVSALLQAINAHDIDSLCAMVAQEYEGLDVNRVLPQRGESDARLSIQTYLHAFPDLRLTELERVVQGDRATVVWRGRGTHLGDIMHIPPTGKIVEVWGSSTFFFERDKLKKAVHVWDVAAMLREFGLLPELS